MDSIFKKSTNVFNAVTNSIKEPYRYDKHGQLKPEYLEDAIRRKSTIDHTIPAAEYDSDTTPESKD